MVPYEYNDDDYSEDYGSDVEDDELAPEDQVALHLGTEKVQERLGMDADKVTVKQIQDALWHYYYDVNKSVAYLTKTYIAPPEPKPEPKPAPKTAPEGKPRIPPGFFSDMPWLDIPKYRATVFIEPPRRPSGLLGGGEGAAPKMSKLQALAAARKKKNDEKKDKEKFILAEKEIEKLSLSDERDKENMEPGSRSHRMQNESAPPLKNSRMTPPVFQAENEAEKPDVWDTNSRPDKLAPAVEMDEGVTMSQHHSPSAFAQTLFGSAPEASHKHRQDVFAMPYTLSSSFFATAFSEPSPDDVVLAAQAKAGKKAPTAPKATKKSQKSEDFPKDGPKDAGVAGDISNLKISDVPPPKSKGLDVVKEFEQSTSKKNASFVVVGHVDAGKSTLMGRLLLELKRVEERTVDKYRRQAEKSGKQSFALAWVMDQRSSERDRGVTIDIATNHFETEATKFTILDAPGHRDFVPNMIAGASQADFAILVIDANTGAYEKGLKGQTREHVLLLRSLGVQRLIVAVNKLDMVAWSQERFKDISEEVSGFLTGLGFQAKYVTFVPISGLNGDNIVRRMADAAASWYTGPTLIEGLEASVPSAARALKKPFRMAISEVFRSQQGATTLSGRVDSGTIQIGDVLLVQPSGETAYIKSIVVDTEAGEWAVAGQNVSLALSDIDPIHIRIGDILCHTSDPIGVGDTFVMKAMAFDHLMPMPVDLHRGRLHAAGQLQSIVAALDKSTGEVTKKKPKVVQPGGVARIQIKLESKVPLEAGQRVVIRSGGETIAAGLLE